MLFYTYMLLFSDGSYYVGHTDDLAQRITQHQQGKIAAYTCTRRPIELVWSSSFHRRDDAFVAERKTK